MGIGGYVYVCIVVYLEYIEFMGLVDMSRELYTGQGRDIQ